MSDFFVIGVAGPAQSGKSTFADRLLERKPHYGLASFADPLKSMLKKGLGLTEQQLYGDKKEEVDARYGKTPRYLMQTLGTEWGRRFVDTDIWVKAMEHKLTTSSLSHFVIPDVRFQNEVDFVRKHGKLLHIMGRKMDIGAAGGHVSEFPIERKEDDLFISNIMHLEYLIDRADGVIDALP